MWFCTIEQRYLVTSNADLPACVICSVRKWCFVAWRKVHFCLCCFCSNSVNLLCLPIWSTQHDSSQPRQDFSAFIAQQTQVVKLISADLAVFEHVSGTFHIHLFDLHVQICICLSWCHCHSLSLAPVNPDWFYLPSFTLLRSKGQVEVRIMFRSHG